MQTPNKIITSSERWKQIQRDLNWLEALQAAGVDNWEGIELAHEILEKQLEEIQT